MSGSAWNEKFVKPPIYTEMESFDAVVYITFSVDGWGSLYGKVCL